MPQHEHHHHIHTHTIAMANFLAKISWTYVVAPLSCICSKKSTFTELMQFFHKWDANPVSQCQSNNRNTTRNAKGSHNEVLEEVRVDCSTSSSRFCRRCEYYTLLLGLLLYYCYCCY